MTEEKTSAWETETGLLHDVDGWVTNPRFGERDEYKQAVAATGAEGGSMMLFDIMDENGEVIGNQGFSIGTGWEVSEDGLSISHPKRANVVGSSMYGQLQNRVVKDLKVDMDKYGKPTEAKSWDRLGFHWMQQEHPTVGGDVKTGLMPVEFLGEFKGATAPAKAEAAAGPESVAEKALAVWAKSMDVKAFQEKALGLPSVAADDELMAKVLDEGPEGFWATHQA